MPKMTTLVNPVCLNKDTFICNNYCDAAFLYSCATNPAEMQVNVWANDLVRPISVFICIWVRVLEGEAGEGLQSPRAQGPDISSSVHACTGDRGSRLNCWGWVYCHTTERATPGFVLKVVVVVPIVTPLATTDITFLRIIRAGEGNKSFWC